jgi:hypothetical protein
MIFNFSAGRFAALSGAGGSVQAVLQGSDIAAPPLQAYRTADWAVLPISAVAAASPIMPPICARRASDTGAENTCPRSRPSCSAARHHRADAGDVFDKS